jgi:bifunctional UDP-N-acetylglucosamine pyrophosphorylase/glucosamine-1-phosphate N-acetyltransferase
VSGAPTVLIMAAGEGTRMRSSTPKVLHTVCGRPMVAWPVLAAREAGAERVLVITSPDRDLSPGLPEGTETVIQPVADGTGGAIRAGFEAIGDPGAGDIVILSGDHPLISGRQVSALLDAHRAADAAATLMTVELDDPGSYGRIVRGDDGDVEAIVETKDPTAVPPDQLAIREINTGTYAFKAAALADALTRIESHAGSGEYYIGDVLPLLRRQGLRIVALKVDDQSANLGVNTRADLAAAEAAARRQIAERHMLAGVTISDPAATWIDADVEIEPDTTLEPGTILRGKTRVAAGATIGPDSTLIDTSVGEDSSIVRSYCLEAEIGDRCSVGPFSYLRPGTALGADVRVGASVEIKNSSIGAGTKVPHLSYIGDADVGAGTNLGASTITANYDGDAKHRTKIGEGAKTAIHTSLVAPVSVGDDAYTGAGAVVREDVPPGALAVSEVEQRNIEGYAQKRAKEAKQPEAAPARPKGEDQVNE